MREFFDPADTQFYGPRSDRSPESIMEEADLELPQGAAKVYALFSGGNDSAVLLHWAWNALGYGLDGAAFIDTGTAIPGVREFVVEFCAERQIPLAIFEAGDAFDHLVLELGGFPGPAGHGRAYTRLKERQIAALIRGAKRKRSDRIVLLTGKRRAESARRAKTTVGVERKGASVWVNPLADWGSRDMRQYRAEHRLPQSDVAALCHRSGECNCGAFAAPGEREMLKSLWPTWFEGRIEALEARAAAAGVTNCRWGERPGPKGPLPKSGAMCTDCEINYEESQ